MKCLLLIYRTKGDFLIKQKRLQFLQECIKKYAIMVATYFLQCMESGDDMSENKQSIHGDILSMKNMLIMTGALVILLFVGMLRFGPYVFAIAAVALAASILVEWSFAKIRKKELGTSWMVTPLIFTMMLPVTAPLWMVAVGSAFGTFFAKGLFGGHGKNIFNPAAVGIIFVTVSFIREMTQSWFNPRVAGGWFDPSKDYGIDAVSAATPLNLAEGNLMDYSLIDLLLGNMPGAIGETFRIGVIVLGIMLILLKIIDWRIPVFYLGTVFVFNGIGHLFAADTFIDPVRAILLGGVMFGAFFVATEPVSAPLSFKGKVMYGIGLGVLTVLIRTFSSFNEGVVFAIVIMNAISPLLDSQKVIESLKTEQTEEVEA